MPRFCIRNHSMLIVISATSAMMKYYTFTAARKVSLGIRRNLSPKTQKTTQICVVFS